MLSFEELENKIIEWGKQKKIFDSSKQLNKVNAEIGELCEAYLQGDVEKVIDGVGDVLVTLIIFYSIVQKELGIHTSLTEALDIVWNVIRYRSGKTVNGTFIKDK